VPRLERFVAEIAQVNALIAALADQTNLLALNATIEAARAGEVQITIASSVQEQATVLPSVADQLFPGDRRGRPRPRRPHQRLTPRRNCAPPQIARPFKGSRIGGDFPDAHFVTRFSVDAGPHCGAASIGIHERVV
jgi:hypothetical protein